MARSYVAYRLYCRLGPGSASRRSRSPVPHPEPARLGAVSSPSSSPPRLAHRCKAYTRTPDSRVPQGPQVSRTDERLPPRLGHSARAGGPVTSRTCLARGGRIRGTREHAPDTLGPKGVAGDSTQRTCYWGWGAESPPRSSAWASTLLLPLTPVRQSANPISSPHLDADGRMYDVLVRVSCLTLDGTEASHVTLQRSAGVHFGLRPHKCPTRTSHLSEHT